MAHILVVDDEIGIRELLSEILDDEGHTVDLAADAAEARRWRFERTPDLVLLDIWMPDTDGITLLKEWATTGQLTMPVIMMSGHATIDTAVEATRIGAMDFLEKPITLQKLLNAVEQGLTRGRGPQRSLAPMPIGRSPAAVSLSSTAGGGPISMPSPAYAPAQADVAMAEAVAVNEASIAVHKLPLDLPLREARDAFERVYFEHHLAREGGSMTRVADRTGLERTHLYRKLKQLGIELMKKKSEQ
jgi:DNA-binding NtrC family response regulator